MLAEATLLGLVINVNSETVEVEISRDIPSTAPVISGRMYRVGQLGTLVKFPIGHLKLFGIVTSVSNTPSNADEHLVEIEKGSRFLQVQLLGEQLGSEAFAKGVGTYPTINDEVHLVTEDDLRTIYGDRKDGFIEIGRHSSSDHLPIFLDLKALVLRHSALLGSTGSGKSNSTANILKSILTSYPGSRIILVDPHGEYESAFPGAAKVFKIDSADTPLHIPFWAMTFDELAFFLVGRKLGEEKPEDKKLREKCLELKKVNAKNLKAGPVDPDLISADSPIPFDIRKMWYDFDREVNSTYNDNSKQDKTTEALDTEGDPKTLRPAKFKPYSPTNTAPYKSKNQTAYPYVGKLYSRLKDSSFDFMFNPGEYYDASGSDLDNLFRQWIDHDKRLTVLDLSGVPFELLDISVGLITRIIFDSMYWGRHESYTGRQRPILMVYEEAHSYLPKSEASSHVYGYSRKAVEKIFKEGRKFGVGAMIVSQRPSEISETILAQVGTFIALRLTNSSDKGQVKSAAPNNMSALVDLLPSLRVGEAVVIGEAIQIPTRVRISLVEPRPDSNDPDIILSWKRKFKPSEENYKSVVSNFRQQSRTRKKK